MKVANAILHFLKLNEVEYIFGLPGGTVSAIYDAINDTDITPIIVKHEVSATYMATKYSMISGKLGVCVVAGGVGANNALNGVAEAMRAKVPVLLLSGHIHTWQIGKGAAQELDTEDIFKPITKYSKTVVDKEKVLEELSEAVQIALTPPYGPVHLSIPIDLQLSEIEEVGLAKAEIASVREDQTQPIFEAIELINNIDEGIILVGNGCRGLANEVMSLSEHLQWPIITTAQGKGVIPSSFKLNLGNYGFAGTDLSHYVVENSQAKCLLVLGSSLGETATRNFNPALTKEKLIIHVDWDIKELGKVYQTHVAIHDDLSRVLPQLLQKTEKKSIKFNRPELHKTEMEMFHKMSLRKFFTHINEILPDNTCFISDIGEYMTFALKYMRVGENDNFIINLNYGSMGSGIGGAIGAYLADKSKNVVVFAGDGSFFMNGSEIFTAKEYNIPIIYFIINNSMLAFVDNGHKFLYGRTVQNFSQKRISISSLMKSAGIKSMEIRNNEELYKIKEFIKDLDEPCVIELLTDGNEMGPTLDRLNLLKTV